MKRSALIEYLVAAGATVLVASVCYPIRSSIGYQSVGLIFLVTISVLSLFLGRAPLISAAILNFGVWNFFFIEPLYTFRVHSVHDLIALVTNLIVALAASALINRIRKSQVTLLKSQDKLKQINTLLESLNDSFSIKDMVKKVEERMTANFNAPVILYLKEKSGNGLAPRPFGNIGLHHENNFSQIKNAFVNQQNADPVMIGNVAYYKLTKSRKSIGVIGIQFPGGIIPADEQLILLNSFFALVASALEREMTIDQLKAQEISAESEKLFRTVLNSVSHELKTPISIISAAASNLNDVRTSSEPELRRQIAEELEIASARMNHLVENILDMSRIESGLLRLNLVVCDIVDMIGIVNNDLRMPGHKLKIDAEENIPFIPADINLLKQAMINIVHNAMTYAPDESEVLVEIRNHSAEFVTIAVKDKGPGVPEKFLPRLFEKFYRVPGTRSGGTGLGLAISKAIIELHGGFIDARNRPGGGLEVVVSLRKNYGELSEV